MQNINIEDLKNKYDEEIQNKPNLLCTIDKSGLKQEKKSIKPINLIPLKQRQKLQRFLKKYSDFEMLLLKTKESFRIEDLYFKEGHYYLVTFAGILTSYEEIPFHIHDITILKDSNKEFQIKSIHDSFRIKTRYFFKSFKVVKSFGKSKQRDDAKYKYVYFDYEKIFTDQLKDIFKNQVSVYSTGRIEIYTKEENGPIYKASV